MDQTVLLPYVLGVLERLSIPYIVVGSFASTVYGEARHTFDIDIVLELTEHDLPAFAALFPEDEYYLSKDAVRQAIQQRFQFNVIHVDSGNKIDFMMTRRDDWGQ